MTEIVCRSGEHRNLSRESQLRSTHLQITGLPIPLTCTWRLQAIAADQEASQCRAAKGTTRDRSTFLGLNDRIGAWRLAGMADQVPSRPIAMDDACSAKAAVQERCIKPPFSSYRPISMHRAHYAMCSCKT
jgi:hypothetical protein